MAGETVLDMHIFEWYKHIEGRSRKNFTPQRLLEIIAWTEMSADNVLSICISSANGGYLEFATDGSGRLQYSYGRADTCGESSNRTYYENLRTGKNGLRIKASDI